MNVSAWEENVIIPTYPAGEPTKHPMFFEKRIYQGSSGVVYPNPVIEKISDSKVDQTFIGVYLENQYLKVMILPELGGRVQMAYDKIRQRHFIYHNQVIKPALVGLCGPWISGGIEFNWPQHHRPSTFQRIAHTIEERADGSKIVWVNEVERMSHTRGKAGFVLHPDKAYLEIIGEIHNRTSLPQTFLWWANPAVKVNDHYQSVFPPDVNAVFDHGKRDVSEFPIAKGTYYKMNYAPGTDISRYKNIPVPTSFMAGSSKFDFIGSYEHDSQAGMLHVANHHISPGKKQWTWGNGEFGKSWDLNLTDEDGPYIELMTGMFTENQPDFAWLQPNEEKNFVQYFMPYAEIGVVKKANKDVMLNLEHRAGKVYIGIYTTSVFKGAIVQLLKNKNLLAEFTAELSPAAVFSKELSINAGLQLTDLQLVLKLSDGTIQLTYQPEDFSSKAIPQAATEAPPPAEIATVEELFLHGLHLEQYRHATYNPLDYYEEALRREPQDSRTNIAVGQLLLRRSQFEKAEPYFRTAINRLIMRNNNPYSGEAYYHLGNCLQWQGRYEEAFEAFYKSVWNDAFQHSGFLSLARIATHRRTLEEALQLVELSLTRNQNSHTTRHLKAIILRKMERLDAAALWNQESLQIDAFNYGCLYEQYVLARQVTNVELAASSMQELQKRLFNSPHYYLEYALDYAQAGAYEEAADFLGLYVELADSPYPMIMYCLGWLHSKLNQEEMALNYFKLAATCDSSLCFPNKPEEMIMLQEALKWNSTDSKAWYYLGNFWYACRQYSEAIDCWKRSVKEDPDFSTANRNLAIACYNKLKDETQALQYLEKAFSCDPSDSRILLELDQLYRLLNYSPEFRLELLNKYRSVVQDRDDLFLQLITLYNVTGNYQAARELIQGRQFHPWEGGEGKVIEQFVHCHLQLARDAMAKGQLEEAMFLLQTAETYPRNLGEGKLFNAQVNEIDYLRGLIAAVKGNKNEAEIYFSRAIKSGGELGLAIYYNDANPEQIFYKAMALKELGEDALATDLFTKLIKFGEQHMNENVILEYFAVSLPDLTVFEQDLDLRSRINCHYLIALGALGLQQNEKALAQFDEVLNRNAYHQGALVHRKLIAGLQVHS